MAKSTVSSLWFVRVDGSESFLTEKCDELANCIDTKAILAIRHLGDKKTNTHVHFVIDTSSSQKQSFAIRIKKLFGIQKRTDYAIEVWDGEKTGGAVSYMFHEEDFKEICRKGFSDEDVNMAYANHQATQKVVAVNKQKASGKLVDRTLEHFKDCTDPQNSRKEILTFMLQEIRAGNSYHPGEFRLKSFMEEVIIKLLPDSELDYYADLLLTKWNL